MSYSSNMVDVSLRNLLPAIGIAVIVKRILSCVYRSESVDETNEEKPVFGSGKMFDKFAQYYDIGNRFMSLGLDQSWRRTLLKEADVCSDDDVLDLATGSADVAISASKTFGAKSVIGLDPSVEMLKVGRVKVTSFALENVKLVQGDAQSMPEFQNEQFDKITMSFGIRNVPDRIKALKEMRRVIRNRCESRLAIMEFSAPADGTILGGIARIFVRYVVPVIGGVITSATDEYQYLEESIFKFPHPEEFKAIIESSGFEVIRTVSLAVGVVNIYIARPRL
jgi:demethylmenaquinone methyltransferase/2-methoxy-6-polyprenyl-1,4-benzoquinol methylase